MNRRRSLPWILLGIIFGLPVLFAGFSLLWLRISFSRAAGGLDDAVAAARKQNIPTNPNELRALTHLADEDNGAELYRQAFAEIKRANVGGADKGIGDYLTGESTPLQDVQVAVYLKSCEPAIRKLELAGHKKGADWNYRWEEGSMLLFPELADAKGACKLLCARAEQRSRAGDTAGAFHDLQTAADLTNALSRTPTLIGVLVQIADGMITLAATETILREHHDPKSLQLARKLANSLRTPDLARGLEGELVLYRWSVQSIQEMVNETSEIDSPMFSDFPDRYFIRDPNFRRGMEAWGVRFWTKAVLAARKENFSIEQRQAISRVQDEADEDTTIIGRLSGRVVPVLDQTGDATARFEAQRRALLGSLDAFESGIPAHFTPKEIDPFTNKPLIYVKKGKGFRVYSLGPDVTDDGGLTRREASKKGLPSDRYDIGTVFK